jgi:hypothetical protein
VEGCQRLVEKVFHLSPAEIENPDVYYHNAYKLRIVQAVPAVAFSAKVEFVDHDPPPGRNSYYARLTQIDGQTAWTSPVWVEQV